MAQKAGIPKWAALVSMDQPQILPLVHFEPHPRPFGWGSASAASPGAVVPGLCQRPGARRGEAAAAGSSVS